MRVLVFGVGAIGSLMVHYLCKAGNDVTVVARSTYEELKQGVWRSAIIYKRKQQWIIRTCLRRQTIRITI